MHKNGAMRFKSWTRQFFVLTTILLGMVTITQGQGYISAKTQGMEGHDGFFKYYWDAKQGKIWLEVENFDAEFLYVNSLPAGIGSNDIGLDRNQLGDSRVVKFERVGPKVLLKEVNYRYRAISDNEDEKKSVEDAFAQSVIWGFKVEAEQDEKVLIDLTPLLMYDAHGVAGRLSRLGQGNYKVDGSRSALYLESTKNFPKNSEFEATVTFSGSAKGGLIRAVTPTPDFVTVRMHHSFVELPDAEYEPRLFDPRSGYSPISYYDYATPIDQSLVKRFIRRHRLKKKNPNAEKSEPVEPIIYYLDRGAPEPIKSALIEGASWWNQAFEAAGYINAFQVKVLPPDADPMDVRYNVINWVHRSTRGWSYGSSVTDPRTGEIIKGHVLLGSLRVRQDFLIAQGLIAAYENGETPDPRLEEMALARLRQLSAHEVGHTLGLAHNFSSSVNDRASVMDYPHPYIQLKNNDEIDFSEAYDVGIGVFDKRTILYGYQDFPGGTDVDKALTDILEGNEKQGLQYVSDSDSRPIYGAHPTGHLWDNGKSAIDELNRKLKLRDHALKQFDAENIPMGKPLASLEDVLVPLYLMHRYQVEAASKLIGGVHYAYSVRQPENTTIKPVDAEEQKSALNALLNTVSPVSLKIPQHILALIPPQPIGYRRGRELFKIHTGLTFDPIGAAESAAGHTVRFLFNSQRLTRIIEQHAMNPAHMSLSDFLDQILESTRVDKNEDGYGQELGRMVEKLVVQHLLQLAGDDGIMQQVSAVALLKVNQLEKRLNQMEGFEQDPLQAAHYAYLIQQISNFKREPGEYKVPVIPEMPDGSPIGCFQH